MPSDAELDILKRTVPMHLLAAQHLTLERRGKEYWSLCPFKKEDTPSFSMYQAADGAWIYKCFGCGVTGNIFQLVQQLWGVDFKGAVAIVQQMTTNSDWNSKKQRAEEVFQKAVADKKEVFSAPLESFEPYETYLNKSLDGQKWLKCRGIGADTAQQFSLGYVQQPRADIVPTNHPWSAKGWILFPEIRHGRVVAVKYRSIMGKKIKKTETEQGWSGFAQRKDMIKSPLYNLEAINSLEPVLVTEGEPDCLVLAQAGFTAVSLPGAGYNPTPEMRDALMGAQARYLAGDMDEAGLAAMHKLHKELGGDNPNSKTYLLQWPAPHKDANAYFLDGCGGNVEKFRGEVERLMAEARDRRLPGIQDLKTVTRKAQIKPTHDNPRRLSFPWPKIDKWVDILPGEAVFMFATETKMGKSTWWENILIHNVLKGKKVINFSAELSYERYAQMVTANLLKKNRNTLTEKDFQEAAEIIPEESFYLGYKPGAKFAEVMKLLADAKAVYGGDIFVVDPLHFILRGGRAGEENSQFAAAMKELVDFAIKWDVIMVVVGQARKSMAGSRGRMAQGQDARGTAAMGEDAATTWILHRDRINRIEGPDDDNNPVYSPITKIKLDYSRNSEAMSTTLIFDGSTASFTEQTSQFAPQPISKQNTLYKEQS